MALHASVNAISSPLSNPFPLPQLTKPRFHTIFLKDNVTCYEFLKSIALIQSEVADSAQKNNYLEQQHICCS